MAVFKNYYNRKAFTRSFTVSCLYLLCSTISISTSTIANGDRVRHHRVKNQLDKSSVLENSSKNPILACPNCIYDKEKIETDHLRLEAIKKQILQKLGLSSKPNVTHSLPKEMVLETLYRAEDGEFVRNFEGQEEFPSTSDHSSGRDMVEVDDFYGRTSEIISFAEEGILLQVLVSLYFCTDMLFEAKGFSEKYYNGWGSRINHNRLLEFQVRPEFSSQMGQDYRVREATLWLKADKISKYRGYNKCRSTDIYVFKIISNRLSESVTLSSNQFERVTEEPVSISLEQSKSGWQRVNLTKIVQTWLAESSQDKLRLFVDCSCCAHWHIHLFNDERDKRSNANRPFLVIHTDPNTTKRVRRRAIDCSVDSGNQCCKQRFYVSFKALGWDDWVIAPQGYYANYCRGDCGHHRTPDMYVSYHTHVIEEVRKTQHLSGMTPCCAPLKFSSISLIYYGPESTIIKRDLPKMVVDECGCP